MNFWIDVDVLKPEIGRRYIPKNKDDESNVSITLYSGLFLKLSTKTNWDKVNIFQNIKGTHIDGSHGIYFIYIP